MKIITTKLPRSRVEFKIELSPEEFERYRTEAVLHLGNEIKVEGFRQGHVPDAIIAREVGEGKITEEAAEIAIRENYLKAVSENKIIPISRPDAEILKIAKGNPFEFKITVSVMPEVKLPDYKKIASDVKRKEISVAENDVKDSLNWLQKSRAKLSLKNAPAQKGDFIEMEFSCAQVDEGKKQQDAFLLGQGRFIPGFEENLEGMEDGEEKEFQIQFPDDYAKKDLAGKKADFKTKIKSVQKIELPELTDDFVKSLGNFENLEALEKGIREGLISEKEKAESERVRNEILDKISEFSESDIPDALLESEKNRTLEDLKARVSESLKIPFEDYLGKIKKTEKELIESFAKQAEKRIKISLVLEKIAKQEKITASGEETKEAVGEVLKHYTDGEKPKKELDLEQMNEYNTEVILNEKTLKFLESFVKK
ncbi:MAG: trigger factor [Patescibacteria group bacterium]